MGNKIFILNILLGVLILCVGTPTDDIESSTSTSVSVSTVARKISSKFIPRVHRTDSGTNVTEGIVPVTEEMPLPVQKNQADDGSTPRSVENGEGFTKPQKTKKKILASNLKNLTEFILTNDKREKLNQVKMVLNVTEPSGVTEDNGETSPSENEEVTADVPAKSENFTGLVDVKINSTPSESDGIVMKNVASTIEGRSLEDRSSQENVNVKGRGKNTSGTYERTTNGYDYGMFGESQKVLSNNFLNNNEGYKQTAGFRTPRPSTSVILPTKKSTPISRDNTLKNTIRFETEYYGPSGQTDWVPIVPEKLPVKPVPSNSQEFGHKLKSTSSERVNRTNAIVIPTDDVGPTKDNNVIVSQDSEVEKTTTHHRNNAEKPIRISTTSDDGRISSTQIHTPRHPTKFRGAVRYKTSQSNVTVDEKNHHQKEAIFKRNNLSAVMEIPTTAASWTLAALGGPTVMAKSKSHPMQEVATEISVVTVISSTNNTTKSQNAVDGGSIASSENIMTNNITKEPLQTTKEVTSIATPSSIHQSIKIKETNSLPNKDSNNGWIPIETIKVSEITKATNFTTPSSVINQSIGTVPSIEVIEVTNPRVETTSQEIIIEDSEKTENTPKVTISYGSVNSTTENSLAFDASIQSINTTRKTMNMQQRVTKTNENESSSREMLTTKQQQGGSTPPITNNGTEPTTVKSSSFEDQGEDVEVSTEVEHAALKKNVVQVEPDRIATKTSVTPTSDTVTLSTKELELNNMNATTASTTKSPVSTTSTKKPIITITTVNASTTTKLTTKHSTMPTESTTVVPVSSSNSTTESMVHLEDLSSGQSSTTTERSTTTPTTSTTVPTTKTTIGGPVILRNNTTNTEVFSSKPSSATIYTIPSTMTASTPISTSTTTSPSPPAPPPPSTTSYTTTTTTTTTPSTTTATSTTLSTTSTTTTTITPIPTTNINPETTEEGIYYKNYVPTTFNPHDEITEENVPAYLRLTVQTVSWEELCRLKEDLRESIMNMLGGKNVSAESVHFLNLNARNCQEKIEETRGENTNGTIFLPVNMFLMDKNGDFDKNLSEAFLTIWGRHGLDFELPIRKVDFVTPIVNLTELADSPLGDSVVAAIIISCVAGICVILLGILFVIMKRRQKRFNYGQRCTPVSLDAYSLDSVSIHNSVRRKGMRASKRSYGNAAFDGPEVPTHPMNFAGLANFSSDKDQLYEEFNIIPQVYPKVEELPAGAETKNRYANIIPLPETRVHLSVKDGDTLSDYINANYVRGLKGAEKLYIACQAPMDSTIEDFWRMVWEQQCKVILMLTDLQENGIEKCADYLPPNEVTDNLRLFGDFQVTLKKRDVKEKYIISNLKLKNMEANLWREVTHLWYLGWPDTGVPSEANSLIAFLIEARSQMKIQNGATTASPTVVHCSPGTGRTGTVIACDLCIREYEQTRVVDIPKCVFNLRRDRAGSVQTKDQYAFIYQVLNVYATKLSGGGIESI